MRWACWITKAAHTPAHSHIHTPAHSLTHTHTEYVQNILLFSHGKKVQPNTHESCVIRTFPVLFFYTFPCIYRDYYEVHRFSREGLKTNNIHKSLCLSSILPVLFVVTSYNYNYIISDYPDFSVLLCPLQCTRTSSHMHGDHNKWFGVFIRSYGQSQITFQISQTTQKQ